MQIVINDTYGGFGLSLIAIKEYLKIKGEKAYFYKTKIENTRINYEKVDEGSKEIFILCFTKDYGNRFSNKEISDEEWEKYCFDSKSIDRTDRDLITVVEKLGEKVNTMCSSLKIIEIPDDVDWTIEEYDGAEWVAEKHRTWG